MRWKTDSTFQSTRLREERRKQKIRSELMKSLNEQKADAISFDCIVILASNYYYYYSKQQKHSKNP